MRSEHDSERECLLRGEVATIATVSSVNTMICILYVLSRSVDSLRYRIKLAKINVFK